MSCVDVLAGGASSRPGGNDIVEWGPPGQQLFGRFNIKKGEGASKTVWEAYDAKNGNLVAWSEVSTEGLSAEERARVAAEVQVLREVRHDRLVDLYASWTADDKVVLITAICESGDLQRFYRTHDVKLKVVKKLCRQILSGIRYLHSFRPPIIHRDLKCENILYDAAAGSVRIGDLGLSTRVLDSSTCAVLGTPNYMAPELYEGGYNEGVDIYSFGMCVLEMVTKRLPYDECGNAAQMYRKVTQGLLPDAFYRIKYPSVQDFIRFCLTPLSSSGGGSGGGGGGLGLQDSGSSAAPLTILRPSVTDVLEHPFLDEHASPAPPEDEVADLCWGENVTLEGGAGTGGGPEGDITAGRSTEGHASGGAASGSGGELGGSDHHGAAADANTSFVMAEEEPLPRRPGSVGGASGRSSPEQPHEARHARAVTVEVLGVALPREPSSDRRSSSAGVGVGASGGGSPLIGSSSGLLAVSNLLVDDHQHGGRASAAPSRRGSGGGLPPSFPASRRSSSLPSATPSRRGSAAAGIGAAAALQPSLPPLPSPVLPDTSADGPAEDATGPAVLEPGEQLPFRLQSDGQPEAVVYAPQPEVPAAAANPGVASSSGGFVMQPLGQPLLAGSHSVMEMAPITVYDAGAMDAGGTADAVMAVQTGYPVSVSPTTALSAHAIHDRATSLGDGSSSGAHREGAATASDQPAASLDGAAEDTAAAAVPSHLLSHGAESLVALGEGPQAGGGEGSAGGEGQSLAATAGGGLVMLTGDAEVPVSGAADMTLPVTGSDSVGDGGMQGGAQSGPHPALDAGGSGGGLSGGVELLAGVSQPLQQEQQGTVGVVDAGGAASVDDSGLPPLSGTIRVKLLLDVDVPGSGEKAAASERGEGRRRGGDSSEGSSGTITRASITFDLDPAAVDVLSTAVELAGRLSFLVGVDLPPALADVIASFLTTQLFGIKTTVTAGPVPAWGIRQLAMWQPREDEAVPGGSERAGWGKSRAGGGAEHGSHRTSLRGRSRGGGGSSAGGTREPLLHHDDALAAAGGAGSEEEAAAAADDAQGSDFPLAAAQAEAAEVDPLASTIPATTAGLLTTLSPLPDYLLSPEKPRRGRRRSRLSGLAALTGGAAGGLGGGEEEGPAGGEGATGVGQGDAFDGVGMVAAGPDAGGVAEDPYLIIDGSASVAGGALTTVTTDFGGVPITGVSSLGGLVPTLDSVGGLDLLSNATSGGYKVASSAGLPPPSEAVTAIATVAAGDVLTDMPAAAASAAPPGLLEHASAAAGSVALPSSVVSHLSPSTASLDASNITPTPTTAVNDADISALSILTAATEGGVEGEAGGSSSGVIEGEGGPLATQPQRLLLSPSVYAAGAPPSDFSGAALRQG